MPPALNACRICGNLHAGDTTYACDQCAVNARRAALGLEPYGYANGFAWPTEAK